MQALSPVIRCGKWPQGILFESTPCRRCCDPARIASIFTATSRTNRRTSTSTGMICRQSFGSILPVQLAANCGFRAHEPRTIRSLVIEQRIQFLEEQELADLAERIVDGHDSGLDVDGYEHANPRDHALQNLHVATLHFGLPEEWIRLDDAEKRRLRGIIEEMRQLQSSGF